uniref:KDO-transferase n=1 Tax=Chlamydia pneumoniae TaxID=83558 RepID=Q46223_CHLPN|nr:KDO-transferase [Chlamydia pneumoniae]
MLDWPTELLLKNRPFDFTGHPEEEKLIKDILLKEEGNEYFSLESKKLLARHMMHNIVVLSEEPGRSAFLGRTAFFPNKYPIAKGGVGIPSTTSNLFTIWYCFYFYRAATPQSDHPDGCGFILLGRLKELGAEFFYCDLRESNTTGFTLLFEGSNKGVLKNHLFIRDE